MIIPLPPHYFFISFKLVAAHQDGRFHRWLSLIRRFVKPDLVVDFRLKIQHFYGRMYDDVLWLKKRMGWFSVIVQTFDILISFWPIQPYVIFEIAVARGSMNGSTSPEWLVARQCHATPDTLNSQRAAKSAWKIKWFAALVTQTPLG